MLELAWIAVVKSHSKKLALTARPYQDGRQTNFKRFQGLICLKHKSKLDLFCADYLFAYLFICLFYSWLGMRIKGEKKTWKFPGYAMETNIIPHNFWEKADNIPLQCVSCVHFHLLEFFSCKFQKSHHQLTKKKKKKDSKAWFRTQMAWSGPNFLSNLSSASAKMSTFSHRFISR